jgi:hypothetical protein
MDRRALLRASDADREAAARRLQTATAEGRLFADELEERLTALYSARTYQELEALVADLPEPEPQRPRRGRSPAALVVAGAAALAVLLTAIVALLAGLRHHSAEMAGPQPRGRIFDVVARPHPSAFPLDVAPLIVGMLLVVALATFLAWGMAARSSARRRRLNAP